LDDNEKEILYPQIQGVTDISAESMSRVIVFPFHNLVNSFERETSLCLSTSFFGDAR
jgi:hypothetical protein